MDNVVEGKVQGKRGARITPRWDPKKWLPVYESIIALSCTGLNNEEVGKRFGYTAQTVSNLRNTPQGKKLIALIAARTREKNVETIQERVQALQSKALERVEEVIFSDDAFNEKPIAIFDRALQVLKSGILKEERGNSNLPMIGGGNQTLIQRQIVMNVTQAQAQQLDDGLNKADQVKVIHSGNAKAGTSNP